MRHAGLSKALAGAMDGLGAKERRQAVGIVHTLFSASAWQLLRDREGMNGREAGEAVAWAVGVIQEALKNGQGLKERR
jgi:hypothetical protein